MTSDASRIILVYKLPLQLVMLSLGAGLATKDLGLTFYPRDTMLAWSLRQRRVCLSVCLSVRHTPVLCLAERKQDREMYIV